MITHILGSVHTACEETTDYERECVGMQKNVMKV